MGFRSTVEEYRNSSEALYEKIILPPFVMIAGMVTSYSVALLSDVSTPYQVAALVGGALVGYASGMGIGYGIYRIRTRKTRDVI